MTIAGEMIEDCHYYADTPLAWVALAAEQGELTYSVAMCFLGIAAEMPTLADDRNLVEQARTVGRGFTR